jgi:hypothetical protein
MSSVTSSVPADLATTRVLRRVVGFMHFARTAMGAKSASIFFVQEDQVKRDGKDARGASPISLIGVKSDWDWARTSFATSVSSWPTVEHALQSGEVVSFSRADAVGLEKEWFGPRGVVHTACVPLCLGERHFGVIFFDFDQMDVGVDKAFLTEVGHRCARALSRPPRRSYRARWKTISDSTDGISRGRAKRVRRAREKGPTQ